MQTLPRNLKPKKTDFFYEIWPIYYSSRTIGLWPFSLISSSNGTMQRTQIRACDALWLLISMCLFIGAIHNSVHLMLFFLPDQKYGAITTIGYHSFEIMALTFGMLAIAYDLINRKQLIEILQKISKFDSRVSLKNFKLSATLCLGRIVNFLSNSIRFVNSTFISTIRPADGATGSTSSYQEFSE